MSEIIHVYCGVKYSDKDEAKSRGAKWDADEKLWYFKYSIKQWDSNENLHTFNYKPIRVGLVGMKDYINRNS